MKAVILAGKEQVRVDELPDPTIQEQTDAIVRVAVAGICGTDVRIYWGQFPVAPGSALGHEFAGVVEAVGPAVERFRPGERVVSPFSSFCGGCFYCRQGILTNCDRRQVFGFGQLGGAQAELVRVPNADAMLESLPDEVSDVQAGFLSDVLPGAFAGLELGGVRPGDVVAVVGCGPTGLCAALSARAMGAATVVAVDHHPERLEAARTVGALAVDRDSEDAAARVQELTEGRGADVAVEATGTAEGVTAALELVRPWGTLVTLGIFLGAAPEFPLSSLLLRHVTLKPAGVPPVKLYIPRLIRLIAKGLLDPTPLAKPLLPLSEAPRGYELMAKRRDGAIKVLLRP